MRSQWRRHLPVLLLVALVVLTVGMIGYAGATSTAAFGPYTTNWEGTTELRSIADSDDRTLVMARNTTTYEDHDPNETVAVLLAPSEPYEDADAERLEHFVSQGGTLFIADRSPHTNELLASVNATTRIEGPPLRDETNYDPTPNFPVTESQVEHPYTTDVETVVLNHGSALDADEENSTILLASSPYAYLDYDRDGHLGEDEELASYPVASVEEVGAGEVIVVSDPSAFINVMLDRGDNRQFLTNIMGEHQHVLIDVSHSAELPPLSLALLIFRETILLQLGVGIAGVFAIWIGFQTKLPEKLTRTYRSEEPQESGRVDEATLERYIGERYPEWEQGRVDRVTSAIRQRED